MQHGAPGGEDRQQTAHRQRSGERNCAGLGGNRHCTERAAGEHLKQLSVGLIDGGAALEKTCRGDDAEDHRCDVSRITAGLNVQAPLDDCDGREHQEPLIGAALGSVGEHAQGAAQHHRGQAEKKKPIEQMAAVPGPRAPVHRGRQQSDRTGKPKAQMKIGQSRNDGVLAGPFDGGDLIKPRIIKRIGPRATISQPKGGDEQSDKKCSALPPRDSGGAGAKRRRRPQTECQPCQQDDPKRTAVDGPVQMPDLKQPQDRPQPDPERPDKVGMARLFKAEHPGPKPPISEARGCESRPRKHRVNQQGGKMSGDHSMDFRTAGCGPVHQYRGQASKHSDCSRQRCARQLARGGRSLVSSRRFGKP